MHKLYRVSVFIRVARGLYRELIKVVASISQRNDSDSNGLYRHKHDTQQSIPYSRAEQLPEYYSEIPQDEDPPPVATTSHPSTSSTNPVGSSQLCLYQHSSPLKMSSVVWKQKRAYQDQEDQSQLYVPVRLSSSAPRTAPYELLHPL